MSAVVDQIINEKTIETFDRDGVVCLRGVFTEAWVDRLRDAVERRVALQKLRSRPDRPEGFVRDINMWDEDDDFKVFAFDSPAGAIAGKLMRSNEIRLFKDQLFVKEPGSKDAVTPWHHDLPYWCVNGDQICSIWMPLDPVDASNGAVEYIRGSHKWDALFSPIEFAVGSPEREPGAYEQIPDIDAERDKYDIVSYEVIPGDCIVFSAKTVHGGSGNASSRWRRAYSTRWAGEDAVYFTRPSASPPLRDPGIAPGEPLRGEIFPLVWVSDV